MTNTNRMLFILNNAEETLNALTPSYIKRTRELKGFAQLEFETDKDISEGTRVIFCDSDNRWNEYIIFDIETIHDDSGIRYSVYCEDSTSELINVEFPSRDYEDCVPRAALSRVLGATRFKEGFIDEGPSLTFHQNETNGKDALLFIADHYGMEINTRITVENNKITNRYIDMVYQTGEDNGKRFAYKKDLISVKKRIDNSQIITLLYPHGAYRENDSEQSNRMERIGIFGVHGERYVSNERARQKYGLGAEKKHISGSVTYDHIDDPNELLRLAKKELSKRSKPKITYELEVVDLFKLLGRHHEKVSLGDVVIVNDKEINETIKTRVIKIEDDPLSVKSDAKIYLGDIEHNWEDNLFTKKQINKSKEDSQIKSIKDQMFNDRKKLEDIEDWQKKVNEKQEIVNGLIEKVEEVSNKIDNLESTDGTENKEEKPDIGYSKLSPTPSWIKMFQWEKSEYEGTIEENISLNSLDKDGPGKSRLVTLGLGNDNIEYAPNNRTKFTGYVNYPPSREVFTVIDQNLTFNVTTKFSANARINHRNVLEVGTISFWRGSYYPEDYFDSPTGYSTGMPDGLYIDQFISKDFLCFEAYTGEYDNPEHSTDPIVREGVEHYPGYSFFSGFAFSFASGSIYFKYGPTENYKLIATVDTPVAGNPIENERDFSWLDKRPDKGYMSIGEFRNIDYLYGSGGGQPIGVRDTGD